MPQKINAEADLEWLLALAPAVRLRFLAELTYGLTIAGRVVANSEEPPEQALELCRELNELQHQTAGYLAHMVRSQDAPDYLRRVVRSLSNASERHMRHQIEQAWAYAKSSLSAAA